MGSDVAQARSRVRVLIPTGLGLNCEQETAHGFRMCGAQADLVHISDVLDATMPAPIAAYHVIAFVGGFAFGDHLGAGVVYANRLRSSWKTQLIDFVGGGGLALGICNGFQTMVKFGLLPGLGGDYQTPRATLAANERLGYRDSWVRLTVEPASPCVWTRGLHQLELPSRHGEGRFLADSPMTLSQMEEGSLVAVRYADDRGMPTQQWPANPNGSPNAIAGICDPTGRLFGLMPHPDAFLYGYHHPHWQIRKLRGELAEHGDGLAIFRNGVEFVAERIAGGQVRVA